MVLPPTDARLRLRISAPSGTVKVTAEARARCGRRSWSRRRPERGRGSRDPAGQAIGLGRCEVSGGRRRDGRHPIGWRGAQRAVRCGGRHVSERIDSCGGSGGGRLAHRLGERRARRVRRAMSGLDHERTHHGRLDPQCRDLHDIRLGGRRRRRRVGAGAFGEWHGGCRFGGGRSCQRQHRLRLDHDPPADWRAPQRCDRRGMGRVRSSFEPGDDVRVDIATVSGTVRLVPA